MSFSENCLYTILTYIDNSNYDYSMLLTTKYYKNTLHALYIKENAYKTMEAFYPIQKHLYYYTNIEVSKASTVNEIYHFLSMYYSTEIEEIRQNFITKEDLFTFLKQFSENIEIEMIAGEKKHESISRFQIELQNIMKTMV